MGASGNEITKSNKISTLLISFAKIKELSKVLNLNSNNKGELSNIFASFIKDNSKLGLEIEEFKKLLDRNYRNFDYKIDSLIKYIIETLHKELNKKKNEPNWLDEFNEEAKNPTIEDFLKCYKKNNDSIIQQLFFGIKEKKLKCDDCKEYYTNFEITKFEKLIELPENRSKIDIRDLVKRFRTLNNEEVICQKCNKLNKHIINTNLIDLPEILIIYLNKINNDCSIDYYLYCQFFKEQYKLICFISNKNENNQKEEQNNVFYLENGYWFIYKTEENRKILIKDICKIVGNPLIIFYQKDRTFYNKFYKTISLLLEDKKNSLELSNEHIIPEIGYEKYYLLNKDWFNKIIKIYEPEKKYSDNAYIIDSFKQVTNITNTTVKLSEFNERFKIFSDENVYKIDYDSPPFEINNSKIQYPKKFVLVKENILNDLLKDLDISTNNYKKLLYQVKFGENHIFIKNNKKENGETIFVCFLNENEFEVGIILIYNQKDYFNKEIKKYISNKGGLEYYYQSRKLKINLITPQKIFDRESDMVGYLINIINLNDYIKPYKFTNIDDIMINGVGGNIHQIDIFEKLLQDKNILFTSDFSNMNYGNNPMNQINMPNQRFLQNITTNMTINKS